jgi:hypothetical protein
MEDYDIEKLIAIAKQPPSEADKKLETLQEPTEAHKFVLAVGIRKGREKIAFNQIYYLYKQWASKTVDEVINPIAFGRQFCKLFKKRRDAGGPYYLLDPEPFQELTSSENEQPAKEEAKKK